MIATYNNPHVGDVLMLTLADSKGQALAVERKGDIARVFVEESQQTVAWNIFAISKYLTIEGKGQVFLTDEQVAVLNRLLISEGFEETVVNDAAPKFVVGQIVSCTPHPDSDHLTICQVAIGEEEQVQIVAGAPNVAVGLKTIVALPGAMMPSGSLIFSGQLRGVDSAGMMCSPRELVLPNAPQVRGIIELDDEAVIGEALDPKKHWKS